jgi:hypothetical protein
MVVTDVELGIDAAAAAEYVDGAGELSEVSLPPPTTTTLPDAPPTPLGVPPGPPVTFFSGLSAFATSRYFVR